MSIYEHILYIIIYGYSLILSNVIITIDCAIDEYIHQYIQNINK